MVNIPTYTYLRLPLPTTHFTSTGHLELCALPWAFLADQPHDHNRLHVTANPADCPQPLPYMITAPQPLPYIITAPALYNYSLT